MYKSLFFHLSPFSDEIAETPESLIGRLHWIPHECEHEPGLRVGLKGKKEKHNFV